VCSLGLGLKCWCLVNISAWIKLTGALESVAGVSLKTHTPVQVAAGRDAERHVGGEVYATRMLMTNTTPTWSTMARVRPATCGTVEKHTSKCGPSLKYRNRDLGLISE